METVSVVICAKNSSKTIEKTLKSIKKNSPTEIIVIDGCSTDNTIDVAKRYTNKIFSDGGNGLAYARQLGAKKALGDFIAYVDSDTDLPCDNLFSQMLKELKKNVWVAIHAQLVDPRSNKTYWEAGEEFHWQIHFNKEGERKYLGTIICLIRKKIVLRYKFDSSFKGAAEDGDFFRRVGKEGYKFGVSKETAYHFHRSLFNDFINQRIWYGKGNAKTIIKHKAINLVFAPFVISLEGILQSFKHKKPKFFFFYIVWGISLFYGTLLGSFQELKSILKIPK